MIIIDGLKGSQKFSLIQNLTNNDSINSYASFASKVHDAWVRVTLFEKQVLIVQVDKLIFNLFHSFFNSFKDQMMPWRRQSKKFSEISHIIFQNHHDNIWVQITIITTKFKESLWFLNQNALLLKLSLFTYIRIIIQFAFLVFIHHVVSLASLATGIIFCW